MPDSIDGGFSNRGEVWRDGDDEIIGASARPHGSGTLGTNAGAVSPSMPVFTVPLKTGMII